MTKSYGDHLKGRHLTLNLHLYSIYLMTQLSL